MSATEILFLDSNLDFLRGALRTVRPWQDSLEVTCTTCPDATLVLVERGAPDVAFVPLERKGLELVRRIRAANEEVSVVVHTAFDDAEYTNAARAAGADAVLAKHALGDELSVLLGRLVRGGENDADAPFPGASP